MRPAPFKVLRPRDLDEGLAALARHGGDAKVIAGGQSLVPLMRTRIARPGVLVDATALADPRLRGVSCSESGVRVGALTTQLELTRHAALQAAPWRALPVAARHIGHYPVQARGTVGGSLAHADPAAELPVVTAAYDAVVEVRSADGSRELAIDDFLVGPFQTALRADELVVGVRLPAPPAGARSAFGEVAPRAGDLGVVAAAVVLAPGFARIALGGVAGRARRCREAERALADAGADAPADGAEAAADAAAAAVADGADAELKRHLVRGLVRELLAEVAA